MGSIWTQTASYDRWLLIEKAACKAWSDEGLIPESDLEKLSKSKYDISILDEVLKDTKHTQQLLCNFGIHQNYCYLKLIV